MQRLYDFLNLHYTQGLDNAAMVHERKAAILASLGLAPERVHVPVRAEAAIVEHLRGRLRVLVLTGEAGDGKTHLLARVTEAMGVKLSSEPVSEVTLDGVPFDVIKDASEVAEPLVRAKLEAIERVVAGDVVPERGIILAVNEGRLRSLLRDAPGRRDFERLRQLADHALRTGMSSSDRVVCLALHRRSLAHPTLWSETLRTLFARDLWPDGPEHCAACASAWALSDPDRPAGRRLGWLLRALHYQDERLPFRRVLSLLARMVCGGRSHEAAAASTDRARRMYYEQAFVQPTGRDPLGRALARLDPAQTARPEVDDLLYSLLDQLEGASAPTDPRVAPASFAAWELTEWRTAIRAARSEHGGEERQRIASELLPRLRRRLFFETPGDELALKFLPLEGFDELDGAIRDLRTDPSEVRAAAPAITYQSGAVDTLRRRLVSGLNAIEDPMHRTQGLTLVGQHRAQLPSVRDLGVDVVLLGKQAPTRIELPPATGAEEWIEAWPAALLLRGGDEPDAPALRVSLALTEALWLASDGMDAPTLLEGHLAAIRRFRRELLDRGGTGRIVLRERGRGVRVTLGVAGDKVVLNREES